MLESFVETVNGACGTVPMTAPELVYQSERKRTAITLHWNTERWNDLAHVRLLLSVVQPGHRKQTAMSWPVADPKRPIELVEIADKVFDAIAPGAPVEDPRGAISRGLDRLLGFIHVNHLPHLAVTDSGVVLSASIWRNKTDVTVMLERRKPGSHRMSLLLPLQAVVLLRNRLARRCGEPQRPFNGESLLAGEFVV